MERVLKVFDGGLMWTRCGWVNPLDELLSKAEARAAEERADGPQGVSRNVMGGQGGDTEKAGVAVSDSGGFSEETGDMSRDVTVCQGGGAGGEAESGNGMPTSLSVLQGKALKLLECGWPVTRVARELGVSVRTVFRWKRVSGFAEEMDRRKREVWSITGDALRDLLPTALEVIERDLEDPDRRVRFTAACAIMRLSGVTRRQTE